MRLTPAVAAIALLACSSSFETRQVTTVQVVGSPQIPVVVAAGAGLIPPPRVIVPVAGPVEPTFAQPPPVRATPLVVAGDGGPDDPLSLGRALARGDARAPPRRGGRRGCSRSLDGHAVTAGEVLPLLRALRRERLRQHRGARARRTSTSVIVGDYTVVAEARDREGRTAQCETQVTMAGHGLRVELSWNTSNTDVDLHMITSRDPRWVTNADCYYANRRPDTSVGDESAAALARRRRHRRRGPREHQGRRAGPRHRLPGRRALLLVAQPVGRHDGDRDDLLRRPARGALAKKRGLDGQRSPNDNPFWRVASVRFRPDGTCAVTQPRGQVVTPQSAIAGVNMGGSANVIAD